MLRAAWRPVPRSCFCAPGHLRLLSSAAAEAAELLRASEAQLGVLPDAADASAKYAKQQFRAAIGVQKRVADIFGAVPDPALQLVAARQLAVLHGLLGDYAREGKQRRAVVKAAEALPSSAIASSATAAAQYELSVSALRAGDLETATDAAAAACNAVPIGADAATAVCEGWAATVTAATGDAGAAIDRLDAVIQQAPDFLVAELQLHRGNVHRYNGGRNESAAAAFQASVEAAGADPGVLDMLHSGLCGVVARVKLGEADMLHVESEAKKMIRGTRNAISADVVTKEQLDAVLDRKYQHLRANVVPTVRQLPVEGRVENCHPRS